MYHEQQFLKINRLKKTNNLQLNLIKFNIILDSPFLINSSGDFINNKIYANYQTFF